MWSRKVNSDHWIHLVTKAQPNDWLEDWWHQIHKMSMRVQYHNQKAQTKESIGIQIQGSRSRTMYQDAIDANEWNLFQKSQQESLSPMKQPHNLGRSSLQILSQNFQKHKDMMHYSSHAAIIQNRHILSQHPQLPQLEASPHSLETMSGNFTVYQKLHYQTEDQKRSYNTSRRIRKGCKLERLIRFVWMRNSQLNSWKN